MPQVLAHPLRLAATGQLTTVEADTDAQYAQDLAVTIGTRLGERGVVPTFGMADPTFDELDAAALTAQVATWGPPVTIDDVTTTYDGTGSATSVVTFS